MVDLGAVERAGTNIEDLGGRSGDTPLPVAEPMVLEVRIEPGGSRHHLIVEPNGYRYVTGPASAPDAWLTMSADLAVALRDGVVPIATAVQSGGIRVGGNLAVLLQHQAALRGAVDHLTADPGR